MAAKMVRREWLLLAILGVFALTWVVGCGSVKRVPVSGAVTLEGKPVDGGYLEFNPDNAKGNTARIVCMSPIKEGRYNLETNGISRADSGAGVPPGWYKVTFRIMEEGKKVRKVTNVPPDKYKSIETTPLAVEVKDDPAPGAYDFDMKK